MAIFSCGILTEGVVTGWAGGGVTTLDMCCPSLEKRKAKRLGTNPNGWLLHHIPSADASGFWQKMQVQCSVTNPGHRLRLSSDPSALPVNAELHPLDLSRSPRTSGACAGPGRVAAFTS